ncbi:MAG: cache domain-containing protein [Gammaproteobacteria bacterium]|jgi:hypothetical protein
MKKIILIFVTLFSLFIIVPTCVGADNYLDKRRDVISFVKSASKYYKKYGAKKAFAEFNNPQGKFVKNSSYIFVYNYKGICKASGDLPKTVGENKFNIKDKHGNYVIQMLINKAKTGGGWVTYFWRNPVTDKVEPKASYVMPLGKKYLIGSGYYVK